MVSHKEEASCSVCGSHASTPRIPGVVIVCPRCEEAELGPTLDDCAYALLEERGGRHVRASMTLARGAILAGARVKRIVRDTHGDLVAWIEVVSIDQAREEASEW